MDFFTMKMEEELNRSAPLADRMRPRTMDEFFGQSKLVGKGCFLYRAILSDRISSMIFYGPPGTGKTSLAQIIAQSTRMTFEKLSAVTSGVKEVREVVARAEERLRLNGQRTILFIDEIHRFNKSQQDALLPYVERGVLILIGATTENPFFEVNKALISRMTVLQLESLSREELSEILDRALQDRERGLGGYDVKFTDEAREYLIRTADGDARSALNSLEIAVLSTEKDSEGRIVVDLDAVKNSIQLKKIRYDGTGDEHYDTISAFIKSMRGSDPDATVYWLAKMIATGEDPLFIARRIMICAAEDVGLADPMALNVAVNAFHAVHAIGMPEGRIPLSEAALYVATAPKSNAAYVAIDAALDELTSEEAKKVPKHLRDGSYPGAKKLGNGIGYLYPHNYESGYVRQDYLPEGQKKTYYMPTDRGYERQIQTYLKKTLDKE